MRKKLLIILGSAVVAATALTGCRKARVSNDEYTSDGKLIVNLRNLYFNDYAGGDAYVREVEKKFNLSFNCSSYSWSNWDTQINGQIAADNVPDVFHANIDSYNFASYYKYWAEEEMTKQLPDDLSKWPNLKNMIDNTSNIESLKLDGHLYGIPISKNAKDYTTSFSPFTYVYRRDWAKKYGVYQENDEYTWEQFQNLLDVFTKQFAASSLFALGDVEWGFPSITNFYKQVPHCFATDESGKYVNNYSTDAYLEGLEKSKQFKTNGWYGYPQYTAVDGDVNKEYYSNRCGVLYENISYSNYLTLRNMLKKTNSSNSEFNVNDATAIMKIKGPDSKYALEGTDNWFSMTFLDFKMSDEKMNKLLDLYDWLLSEEGTRFSIYGIEGYDYIMNGDKIELIEEYWPKNSDGTYAEKTNGAKFLRYMVSLGYDTYEYDPLTDKESLTILNNWEEEMKKALEKKELKVLKENAEVMWLTSPLKAENSGMLRTEALANAMTYIYSNNDINWFKSSVTSSTWTAVLNEINEYLGKK